MPLTLLAASCLVLGATCDFEYEVTQFVLTPYKTGVPLFPGTADSLGRELVFVVDSLASHHGLGRMRPTCWEGAPFRDGIPASKWYGGGGADPLFFLIVCAEKTTPYRVVVQMERPGTGWPGPSGALQADLAAQLRNKFGDGITSESW